MPIYFIADLHLSESHPQLTALFQKFIQEKAARAQAVYILGDLFDFWIGDDENSPLVQTIKQTIRSLTDRGVACYFIHGNRDFLIGKTFARDTGMTLLPEYAVIDLFGTPTLLCHGDTLCTDDHSYQKFRRTVHQKWLQRLFLLLPLTLRLNIATKIRKQSKQDKQHKTADIMDVNPTFTHETVQRFHTPLLIHGHTHRENIHRNDDYTRIVLGDWRDNYASILEVNAEGYRFIAL